MQSATPASSLSRPDVTVFFRRLSRIAELLLVCCAIAELTCDSAAAVTIEWLTVGNPGNAADAADGDAETPGVQNFGSVPYAYKIGKYDVTNSQYVEFLNAKDPTGANSLRIFSGGPPYGGITYSAANVEGSKYSVIAGKGSHPVNFVTWYSAVRFTNWLNNGQGDGDTETGAYTLGPLGAFAVPLDGRLITRNAGATVFLPSENEWYKAAYFDPRATAQGGPPADGHYWLYPTASNTPPTASDPTAMENHANYYNIGYITTDLSDVGAYTNTTSPYGAFDMGGNVWQWNEELITTFNSAYRGRRGGSFSNVIAGPENMRSSARWDYDPRSNGYSIGIRVASVPEPNTGILTIAACVIIWFWRRR